ncbi:hypothetical protein ENSA7_59310 [Enhygromyxa salina]|uniref:Uncharacterized protein n=2 Tax=Enhygromyxa salina TaxID=215803 RepID=A0A2S9Y5P8_9BACT|nr:hypothetical protein ENSA7_59310 [Enhygromyxa salina]
MSNEADLALADMSVFHGDGERLAFARDGRVLYERLDRERGLLRWTAQLDADGMAELVAVAERLAEDWPALPQRPGIPDEVMVTFSYRNRGGTLVSKSLWERDFGELAPGHPVLELRGVVKRVGASLVGADSGAPQAEREAGDDWPHVLDRVAFEAPGTGGEKLVLVPGRSQTSASGFTLTLGATPFEARDMSSADVSSPAIAIQRVELIVSRGGQTERLHFTEPSPGVASRVRGEWQGHAFVLESIHHVDKAMRVVFRVEPLDPNATSP